jgi:hypothetical protein
MLKRVFANLNLQWIWFFPLLWTSSPNFKYGGNHFVSHTYQLKSSAVYTWEKSVWQVEHRTIVSPFVEGLRQFHISVYSCLHLSLITGSDFFKLSPLLALGMPPFIFRRMLLDHQSVCKEHGHTIIIKRLNDKESVLRSVIYHVHFRLPYLYTLDLTVKF